ncbi:Alpha/Beta hydrolase protein [Xylariaceae sp. FL0016]|nr:Alpha/Beta hydrolase protein [Xylariaceae sp. FL0016]
MAALTNPQILELPDQRKLSYAIFGDRENAATTTSNVIFYFCGWPSGRDEACAWDDAARRHHIRLVAVDRPGHGASGPQPRRTLLDWPRDVLALADRLGAARFAVLGVSGGFPYALACLRALPRSRCVGAGGVAGLPPMALGPRGMMMMTRVLFGAAQWSTRLVALVLDAAIGRGARGRDIETQEKNLTESFKGRPRLDQEAWAACPEFRRGMAYGLRNAFQEDGKGAAWEAYLFGSKWPFELEDIILEPGELVMWHGYHDENVPLHMVEKAVKLMPNAELRLSEDAHLSIMVNKRDEVMETLGKML